MKWKHYLFSVLIILLFSSFIIPTNAATLLDDDFYFTNTSWIEVDANNRFVRDTTADFRLEITGMTDTEANERVLYDLGSDPGTNWSYYFTWSRTNQLGGTGLAIAVANTNNSPLSSTWNDSVVFLFHTYAGTGKSCFFFVVNAGSNTGYNLTNPCAYNLSQPYYGELNRSGDTYTLKLYNNSAKTDLFLNQTQTKTGLTDMRYIYAITNYGDLGNAVNGWVDDILFFNTTPTIRITNVNYSYTALTLANFTIDANYEFNTGNVTFATNLTQGTFNTSTGVYAWTPDFTDLGTYYGYISVTDSLNTVYRNFTLTVSPDYTWTRYWNNPIWVKNTSSTWYDLGVYVPRLIKYMNGTAYQDGSGRYMMLFAGMTSTAPGTKDSMGLLYSTDLYNWTIAPEGNVFPLGAGAWEDGDCVIITVLVDTNGTFHAWYEANSEPSGGDYVTIGYANSTNGTVWGNRTQILTQGAGDDSLDLYGPTVKYHNGSWRMWYTGHNAGGQYNLMYATATNPWGPWTKYSDYYIATNSANYWTPSEIWEESNGTLQMTYLKDGLSIDVAQANDSNGLNWTELGSAFDINATAGSWDDGWVYWPSQVEINDTWYNYYTGWDGSSGYAIGVTTSYVRTPWSEYLTNSPPTVPSITSPSNGSTVSSINITWDASTDPDGDSITYHYQLSNQSNFSSVLNESTGLTVLYSGTLNQSNGLYYARVHASDGLNDSAWSTTVQFDLIYTYQPPSPVNLTQTNNSVSWINHTWAAGTGNITDSYNVSINGVWYNGTTNLYYNHTGLSIGDWSNISVYAWNSTSPGALNSTAVSQNIQLQCVICSYILNGTVSNSLGAPLVWAKLTWNSTDVFTNASGFYEFPIADIGIYTLLAQQIGYTNYTETFDLTMNTTKNITLSEKETVSEDTAIDYSIVGAMLGGLLAFVLLRRKRKDDDYKYKRE